MALAPPLTRERAVEGRGRLVCGSGAGDGGVGAGECACGGGVGAGAAIGAGDGVGGGAAAGAIWAAAAARFCKASSMSCLSSAARRLERGSVGGDWKGEAGGSGVEQLLEWV